VALGAIAGLAGVLVGLGLGAVLGTRALPWRRDRGQSTEYDAGAPMSELLQRVVSAAPIGVVVIGTSREIVISNQRAGELGLVRERVLDDRVWSAAQRTLISGADGDIDLLAVLGSPPARRGLSVRGHVRLLRAEEPRLAVVYLDDQSEQARMEASRRDFVANVSHELKTPVAAMGVLAEAMLESADDPDTSQRFGRKLLTESQRLAGMIGELIELSRLQGAERLPDLVRVDVDTVVQEAISRYKVAADTADITVNTDDPTDFAVLGDQPLLVTAVANLISNAIAYSPDGSSVSISRRRYRDSVEIAVTDRGIGIAKADQERVFERFFRVDKARSRTTGGTGLGLAIVKHVAANHNGTIRLWSRPGTGSTFTLSIPVCPDEPAGTDDVDESDGHVGEEEAQ
jgi:two-component system sensor histidine kinase SenX3